jgi:elongation factor Ts
MQVSTEAIKTVRDQTWAGIMECKRALVETEGDIDAAVCILRDRGQAIAEKKAARVADEGLIESYVHTGGRVGAMIELNCESDFVAKTPEFKQLAHDLAMQVVGVSPRFVSPEDVPEGVEYTDEDCLLLQPFIREPGRTVGEIVTEAIAKVRENIKVRRFVRFELGLDGQDE